MSGCRLLGIFLLVQKNPSHFEEDFLCPKKFKFLFFLNTICRSKKRLYLIAFFRKNT